jgi:general nucleoside transport system permease protein
MTVLDTGNPLAGPPGAGAPTEAYPRPDPLSRLPRSARFALYFVVTFGILSLAQVITGADQLTAENTFRFAIFLGLPIGLAGLGGLWAERAGVVNIGLEGMMILGTWFGAYGAITWGAWEGVAFGMVGGALGGLLHAVATVSFGVDHIISGVAINLLGVGFTNFLTPVAYPGATRESPPSNPDILRVDLLPFTEDPLRTLSGQGRFFLSDLADLVLALTTNVSLLVIVAVAVFPASWYVLWRTPFGLRLRSVGEDPEAADSLGVKVLGIKYFAVSMSGAFAGLGGVTLVYLFSERFQQGQTNGRGYIGLAAMLFGNWRPGGLVAGAGLFGFMDSVRTQVPATGHAVLVVAALAFVVVALRMALRRRFTLAAVLVGLAGLFWWWYQSTDSLPREITPYFPHITTLLVLIFAAQRLRMPAANGRIYRRGGR